jgi:RNA polymerase sigma-70 factor (ECF subfamily)
VEQQTPQRTPEEFEAFYRREYRAVVGLAFVLSGSRTGAEELAQDAFAAAYRDWSRVGAYDKPGAWVRRVVSNRSVSRFRRLASEARALARIGAPTQVPEFTAETLDVWKAVRSLPKRQAQAIALHHLLDLPVAEVAATLECSVETVRTHLKRGRAALAERIER